MISKSIRNSLFIICFLFLLLTGCNRNYESTLVFDCEPFQCTPFVALNGNARKAHIQKPENSPYAYFAFSEEQISYVKALENSWKSVSFSIVISDLPKNEIESEGRFVFGLLYSEDFDSNGKLKKNLADRPMVHGYINEENEKMQISLASQKGLASNVKGLFLYSEVPVQITKACIIPAEVGFDLSSEIPAFFFGTEGGIVPSEKIYSISDFSNAYNLFNNNDAQFGLLPVISVNFEEIKVQPSNPKNQLRVELNIGSEKLYIRQTKDKNNMIIHCSGLKNPYSKVYPSENENLVTSIRMKYEKVPYDASGKIIHPLVTDPGMIPLWNKDNWRTMDYELFSWEQFPNLLFIDTLDYSVQDDFFKRLAFFTEKTGYVGTLVPDKELYDKHGFNAHDYRSETLADFFTLALKTNFPLNAKEVLLRDILVYNKIILPYEVDNKIVAYKPGSGGIISISQQSAMYLRYTFICHEGLHGLYFIDDDFKQYVSKIFNQTDKNSLNFLLRFFQIQSSLNYNLEDTYLIQNEFMAYVMQQPVNRTGSYFADNIACRGTMIRGEPELSEYVRNTKGYGFTEASQKLSDYVFNRWGMESGRVSLVYR